MAIEVFSRYENKFLLDSVTCRRLQKELLMEMEPDEYNKTHEFYTISNLYLDTEDHYLIRTSLSKPKYKEKLRLRAYGVPELNDKVYLEIKKKFYGLVNKRRTALKLDEAYKFIDTGEKPELRDYMNKQVLSEIDFFLSRYQLKPRVYLAYDRKAFFSKTNRDLRITFDTHIRTRRYDLALEMGDYGEPLLDKEQWLMEIKTPDSIPKWLTQLLTDMKVYKTSFSKYGKEYEKLLMHSRETKGEMNVWLKPYSVRQQLIPQFH